MLMEIYLSERETVQQGSRCRWTRRLRQFSRDVSDPNVIAFVLYEYVDMQQRGNVQQVNEVCSILGMLYIAQNEPEYHRISSWRLTEEDS